MKEMNIIRSENHNIYSMTINKVALSANDDKRLRGILAESEAKLEINF